MLHSRSCLRNKLTHSRRVSFPRDKQSAPTNEFLRHLQDTMRSALPMPLKYHGKHPEYTPNNLAETGYVYVRHDAHRGPLQRPYKGPFKILNTAEKHFTLEVNGHPDIVSIDRLKTAYGIVPPTTLSPPPPANSPVMTQSSTPAIVQQPSISTPRDNVQAPPPTSRYGRKIKKPLRFIQVASSIPLHSTEGGTVALEIRTRTLDESKQNTCSCCVC